MKNINYTKFISLEKKKQAGKELLMKAPRPAPSFHYTFINSVPAGLALSPGLVYHSVSERPKRRSTMFSNMRYQGRPGGDPSMEGKWLT